MMNRHYTNYSDSLKNIQGFQNLTDDCLNSITSLVNFMEDTINDIKNQPYSDIKTQPSSLKIMEKTPKQMEQVKIFEKRQMLNYYNNNEHRKQCRYQEVCIPIPLLDQTDQKKRQKQIRKWLGFATKEIFSIGFNYFEIVELDEKDVKVFCSENLISNILHLINKNNLAPEQIADINRVLGKQLIPYYSLKYPHSTQPQVNLAFASQVVERDNFSNNEYDLVFHSGIKFQYQEDKNYNPLIMKFLNYILGLYQKKITVKQLGEDKEYSITKRFNYEILKLFEMVEVEETVKDMLRKNPKNVSYQSNSGNKRSEDPDKYLEKVRSYTDFLISKKISNTRNFTEQEINLGTLKLKIPSLMRLVTKWCQELKQYFSDDKMVLNRSIQFRMRNGEEMFLGRIYRQILKKLLMKQNEVIESFLESITTNNVESLKHFEKWSQNEDLCLYSQMQSEVGIFCSAVQQNYQFYQLAYLNELIHGLLTVNEQFIKILYIQKHHQDMFNKYKNREITLQQLITFGDQNISQWKLSKIRSKFESQLPEFISFRIGDLLRCRCFSRQRQIMALYSELMAIDQKDPERMKIIRIKNKLEKGTKDILINILFHKTIIIEVQLGINEKPSQFSLCANKFQHYLYELERASFGPLSELCKVWWILDERGKFYKKQLQKMNVRSIKNNNIVHQCVNKSKGESTESVKDLIRKKESPYYQITLPFLCQFCHTYYFSVASLQRHYLCEKCNKKICYLCHLSSQNKNINEHIPERGQLLNLKSKKEEYRWFKKVVKNKKTNIYEVLNIKENRFRLLKEIGSEESYYKFLKENIMLPSQDAQNQLQHITDDIIYKFYEIPQKFRMVLEKKKTSIALVGQGISDEIFNHISDIEVFPDLQRVSLSQNSIRSAQIIFLKFREAQIINLSANLIESIPAECEMLKKLKQINLSRNNIVYINPNFSKLENLVQLDLSFNQNLTGLPEDIDKLADLEKLFLQNCISLIKLPDNLCRLQALQYLDLQDCCRLESLPLDIGNLVQLIFFNLKGTTSLSNLPPSMERIKKVVYSSQIIGSPASMKNKLSSIKQAIFQNRTFSLT